LARLRRTTTQPLARSAALILRCRPVLCAILWLLFPACSEPTDAELLPDPSPPGTFTVTAFRLPLADSTAAQPVNPAIQIALSDFPDPDTVNFPTIRLGPAGQSVQFSVETSLVDRQLTLRPRAQLQPNLDYFVSLGSGLTALSGQPLTPPQRFRFRTGDAVLPVALPTPSPTLATLLQPDGVLRRSCALAGCHSTSPGTSGPLPAVRGLDLAQPADAVRMVLVGGPRRGLDALKLVAPGQPERSYLLRKLLAGQGFTRSEGEPMPPLPAGQSSIDLPTLRAIEQWIRDGAN
jgi:hypothetical protein